MAPGAEKGLSYDHIVIGAGIVGSCTALSLVRRGKKILLLEQFTLPHTRGSSHGQSRLIRTCYAEDFFAQMMGQAFRMWAEMEEESGLSIIRNTGTLCVCKEPFDEIEAAQKNLKKYRPEVTADYLQEATMKSQYPFIRYDLQGGYRILMDSTGGAIMTANALKAAQSLFQKAGGHIVDTSPVKEIVPGQVIKVVTSTRREFFAPSVVVCCGPWSGQLLEKQLSLKIPLQAQRVNVFYFREKETGSHSIEKGCRTFLDFNSCRGNVYGFPSIEYPGCMKVCAHFGVDCDPDRREQAPNTGEDVAIVSSFIEEHLPGLENTPAIVESCMYTMTPDELFVLDRHPKHNNIIIGAGFSGTGFKLAPLTGSLLADLATDTQPSHDLKHFQISRFDLN